MPTKIFGASIEDDDDGIGGTGGVLGGVEGSAREGCGNRKAPLLWDSHTMHTIP